MNNENTHTLSLESDSSGLQGAAPALKPTLQGKAKVAELSKADKRKTAGMLFNAVKVSAPADVENLSDSCESDDGGFDELETTLMGESTCFQLLLKGVRCHRGVLLLSPANCKVLGGEVAALQTLSQSRLIVKESDALPPIDQVQGKPVIRDQMINGKNSEVVVSAASERVIVTAPTVNLIDRRSEASLPVSMQIVSGMEAEHFSGRAGPTNALDGEVTNVIDSLSLSSKGQVTNKPVDSVEPSSGLDDGCQHSLDDELKAIQSSTTTFSDLVRMYERRAGHLSSDKSELQVAAVMNIIPHGIRKFKTSGDKFVVVITAPDANSSSSIFELLLADEVCQDFLGITAGDYQREMAGKSKADQKLYTQQYGARFEHFKGKYWVEVIPQSATKFSGAANNSQSSKVNPVLIVTRKAD